MRVPLSWLKEYVDITLPVEELAYRLTLAGLEIGAIDYIGVPSDVAASKKWAMPYTTDHLVWDREKIVVGHILEVKSHPDADSLILAMVESGVGEVETVVTGAPNLISYEGQGPINPPLITPYAREGAEVIDGHKEDGSRMILKPRKLRGIENRSMVCSEKELGLSEEHEGILFFETDAAPGTPLQDVLGDIVLDIELTPNLARCFSIVGVAREVAALTGKEIRLPSQDVTAIGPTIEGQAKIDIREPELNPRFTLALIKGAKIEPSPGWMQRRLIMIGMRPINNIVDITNYVMIETGQPLHAFDYDILVKRADGTPTIITRLPEDGEKLTTLDDVERELDPFTILVADTAGSLSLGGIMGGEESEVHDGSVNILLEAANWNYINMRETLSAQRRRGMEILSEAGARFSRGVHPAQALGGLLRAIELMRVVGGGEIAEGIIDSYPRPEEAITIDLPISEAERIIGIALSQDEIAGLLGSLGFGIEKVGNDIIRATVPEHRMDIGRLNFAEDEDIRESIGQADLIEEIARVYGYDKLPMTMISDVIPPQHANEDLTYEELVRDVLTRAGLQEIITHRMTHPDKEAKLTPPGSEPSWADYPYVELINPIHPERNVMRHTLMTSTLDILVANSRWQTRQAVFEVGHVYLPGDEQLPAEPRRLSIALMGERLVADWQMGAGAEIGTMDFYDLRGVIDSLLEGLHLGAVDIAAGEHSSFYPGRSASIKRGKKEIGTFGELHPVVAQSFGLTEAPVMIAEIDLDALLEGMSEMYEVDAISSYPAHYQDIALIVDEPILAADVEAAIWEAGGMILREITLFDVYRGEQIGADKKSLAYSLVFQSEQKTLKDKDINKIRKKLLKHLKNKVGAELRA